MTSDTSQNIQGFPDERDRYRVYLAVMRSVDPAGEAGVIARIMRDQDRVTSEAAITRHIDDNASSIPTDEQFLTWAEGIRELVQDRPFLLRRLRGWGIFPHLQADRPIGSDETLSDATD